ncbi:predicted protein [Aspergillus terreus NIH2624]|uniref:Aspartate aminotransferase n=1 Tax=Aspergillus terreus (strain NIH 2624 / FGSC A1156) TaxID=341663 RepID=Q0CGM4_ASPTN|nr:uncharacterized protein ATEG_07168 [Aspergillus terreus NIH2624]EAU32552.1 predicted protein [Aspergillus terreus NIH2624]
MQLATCQTLSGTGALHLAGRILRDCQPSSTTVYIPEPTWSNHHFVFSTLGFECQSFRYYDPATKTMDMDSYRATLYSARPGSIVILHACAHNPTGLDPTHDQWMEIGQIIKQRDLFPLFDAAYLGFNSGDVDHDAFAIRHFIHELELEAAVCLSFAKNMGLYGERVGCLVLATATEHAATNSQSLLESLQRSEISNPPAFGARIAARILGDEALRAAWFEDLKTMSARIQAMRRALYDHLARNGSWDHLLRQSGMFGFLGLPPSAVKILKEKHHIYMASNSRISIAGLNPENVEYVARCIVEVLQNV